MLHTRSAQLDDALRGVAAPVGRHFCAGAARRGMPLRVHQCDIIGGVSWFHSSRIRGDPLDDALGRVAAAVGRQHGADAAQCGVELFMHRCDMNAGVSGRTQSRSAGRG